jgi:hypothetical protein
MQGDREVSTSVLVLSRLSEKTSGGTTSSSLTVWPLVHCTREQERRAWSFPALIPFYGDEWFNRTWGEFLTLAKGSRDGASSSTNNLWKSFYQEQGPSHSRWSFLFLVSHGRRPSIRVGLPGKPHPVQGQIISSIQPLGLW